MDSEVVSGHAYPVHPDRSPEKMQPGPLPHTGRVADVDAARRLYLVTKRVLDIIVATVLLVLMAPAVLVIAILIKLDSPGPVIFKQERVGARRESNNGQDAWEIDTFTFFKFRSMRNDADSALHRAFIKAFIEDDDERMADIQQVCREEISGPRSAFALAFLPDGKGVRKLTDDPRITPVGRILRRTSLDEVPQFWNVLKGDMSLVGPRPPIPYEVEEYKPWHLRRLEAQPGLTGLWQVGGRSSVDFDEMVRLDIQYIEKQSLWLDLKILAQTPLAVLTGKGAE